MRLLLLGLLLYTVTQGAQFLSLFYLPAITANLMLSFTTVLVAFLGIFLLGERPTPHQWLGLLLYAGGVVTYFYPATLPLDQVIGIVVATVGVLANALSAVLGRHVNRAQNLSPLAVTVTSMGIGAVALLATGLLTQGLPRLSVTSWAIIVWLSLVNTAFAFTLWNHTLRTLPAMQSSIINSTMMIQIPVLAVLFLGEQLFWREGIGLLVAGAGILVVQIRRQSIPSLET
jgi:drug/metabolite transporter (DMT)-like permease